MKKLILILAVATTLISCNKADRHKSCQVDVYSSEYLEEEGRWSIDATKLTGENVGFYRDPITNRWRASLDPSNNEVYSEVEDGVVLHRIDSESTSQAVTDDRPSGTYYWNPFYLSDVNDGAWERVTEFRVSCK